MKPEAIVGLLLRLTLVFLLVIDFCHVCDLLANAQRAAASSASCLDSESNATSPASSADGLSTDTDESGRLSSDDSDTDDDIKSEQVSADSDDTQIAEEAKKLLNAMTLEEKVYQLFLVTPEQLTGVSGPVTRAGSATEQALLDRPVGGIIYFADNLQTREQVMEMICNSQQYSKTGLFIAVDEEGGSVSRVGRNEALGTTAFPAMGTLKTTDDAYQAGLTMGTDLRALGFNLDFAPIADVNSNLDNPVIGTRAFSSDPETAAEMVSACVTGFRDANMLCTLKHWPGHGDTAGDSHAGSAETSKTLEEMEACEFLPFQSGIQAGAPFVMVGHINCPAVTGADVPASLSSVMVEELLREALGFEGIIITDSMQMKAITNIYSSGDAAVAALQAGADMLLMPADLDAAAAGILTAIQTGVLEETRIDKSVLRILSVKLASEIC